MFRFIETKLYSFDSELFRNDKGSFLADGKRG